MIVKAVREDIPGIMEIIGETVEEMKGYGNTQWDENYPKAENFLGDIEGGTLYVLKEEGELKGFVCIDFTQPGEYSGIEWSSNERCMVIHRMAVGRSARRQGIGRKLMEFAEVLAGENGVEYLKTDTYSINENMNILFRRCGFIKAGEMSFLGKEKPFYCYEKLLRGQQS